MKNRKNLGYKDILKIVKSTIQPYTYPKISIKKISEKSDMSDLGLDSLDFVNLVIGLEKRLGIIIPDEDAEKFGYNGDPVELGKFTEYIHGLFKNGK